VIATASRTETQDWVKALGAHHVIDHSKPLAAQVNVLGLGAPAFVFSTTHTATHVAEVAELIAPQGRFCLIDDPKVFDIMLFKRKAVSIHHELMFHPGQYSARQTWPNRADFSNEVSRLVDEGKLRSTLTTRPFADQRR